MSVFGGLFHAKEAPAPIVIPVPATVPVAFRVYYVPGYPPLLPDDLRARALAWIDAHAEEPLRSALKPIVSSSDFTYTDMAKTSFPPPLEVLTAAAVGAQEKERLEKAWQVAVVACNTDLRGRCWGSGPRSPGDVRRQRSSTAPSSTPPPAG